MKKRALLFTLLAGISILSLSSYDDGPAHGNLNCTGAQNSTTTCGGLGCHGGTSANTSVAIVVMDQYNTAVTKYVPGATYTINITGHNTSSLPKFGYQYVAVSGTGANQVQAGTNVAPANSQISPLNGLNFVEHATPLTGAAGTYTVSFPWTAPVAGKGTVIMYCTLNAVNGDDAAGPTDLSNNTSITLTEGTTGVAALAQNIDIKVYPNPVSNQFSIKMDNATTGTYTVNVFDMSGRKVYTENIQATSATTAATINCGNWAKGYYGVQISQNGAQRVLPLVKI